MMNNERLPEQAIDNLSEPAWWLSAVQRFGRYAVRRFLIIAVTIFLGVYVTVVIANQDGQIDRRIDRQIIATMREYLTSAGAPNWLPDPEDPLTRAMTDLLRDQLGGNLPKYQRNIIWTIKTLTFDWGPPDFPGVMMVPSSWDTKKDVGEIILDHLPNTLLLIGTADLLIFLFGIPLALHIGSKKRGEGLDRFLSMISPVSSIPSWIHGILLVAIFAAWLRWLPFGGKFDNLPPDTQWGYILVVGKHMVLPVAAILMGMFFQLVYVWRTFLMLYSAEDYVDLAIAKGLDRGRLEQKYILRPAMPYILTSFALTLMSFWQMTTALEYFFNWPGIGQLYVRALPNFLGEQYYVGEMGIILSVVALFAYLLGFIVFILDLLYSWLDPRIRLQTEGRITSRLATQKRVPRFAFWKTDPFLKQIQQARKPKKSSKAFFTEIAAALKDGWLATLKVFREIFRYPSAVIGVLIITLMLGGSVYTVVALPYAEIGEAYYSEAVSGRIYAPRNALPEWINGFRAEKLPASILLSSTGSLAVSGVPTSVTGNIEKTYGESAESPTEINFKITFPYNSREFPQDLFLYLFPTYVEKRPFIIATWITPDGREFSLKNGSAEAGSTYNFSDYVNTRAALADYPQFKDLFYLEGDTAVPSFQLLMADPNASTPAALPGNYILNLEVLTFEENSDLDLEFVLLGKVAGFAGTDSLRRDLTVPLLWGMPFALGFGLLGALITTISSMIISALGVWQGGWVDSLIQQLTDVNMILPVLAVGILVFALFGVDLYMILAVVVLLNIFGTPTKLFRAAFLQVKEAPYIEAARSYGASPMRIIFRYMIPRILPTAIPQLVSMIPGFVFLEATLAIFNVFDPRYPTWGKIINVALTSGAWWSGFQFWILEPIVMLLLAGLGFSLVGFALERILNPRLLEE